MTNYYACDRLVACSKKSRWQYLYKVEEQLYVMGGRLHIAYCGLLYKYRDIKIKGGRGHERG